MTRKELNVEYQKYLIDPQRYRRQLFDDLTIFDNLTAHQLRKFFKEKGLKECTRCGIIQSIKDHGKDAKCKRCETFIRGNLRKKQSEKDPNFKLSLKLRPYNCTPEQYLALEELAHNKCQICGKEFTDDKDKHLDHCHETKNIRGLLCTECNLGLGLFKDCTATLKKAINYLMGS
jgi:hypothetical protein